MILRALVAALALATIALAGGAAQAAERGAAATARQVQAPFEDNDDDGIDLPSPGAPPFMQTPAASGAGPAAGAGAGAPSPAAAPRGTGAISTPAASGAPGALPAPASTPLPASGASLPAPAAPLGTGTALSLDTVVVDARDALRRRDRERLATARTLVVAARHPLAPWVDYWELSNRLAEASQDEFSAFSERWRGTYVEDRLRNDWLLELIKRRDWVNFAREYPRFRMNDDRSVLCVNLMLRQAAGENVRDEARQAWFDQDSAGDDEGCGLMAQALLSRGVFGTEEAWQKARRATEDRRLGSARQAVGLVSAAAAAQVPELFANPARFLARRPGADGGSEGRDAAELAVLALARLAAKEPALAASLLDDPWRHRLRPEQQAWLWASIGRQAASELMPEADGYFQRSRAALAARSEAARAIDWSQDTLAWKVRAALRAGPRWAGVLQAVAAMDENQRAESTWVYWQGRALQALAESGPGGDAQRAEARRLLAGIATRQDFYGRLAAEALQGAQPLPPLPAPVSAAERAAMVVHPGLSRALALIDLGLRSEGVREWNFSLRGMDDRQLLAAAQRACDAAVWDRCISTSERTRGEIDITQRFPLPYREEIGAAAREAGIDAALVYGLIRQESRFVSEARSGVGASGLMQVMPATARIVARKLGMADYSGQQITERRTNLRLGAGYFRMVLDDFEGSHALAAAAYNAGPNRPRRWRDGPRMEVAAWAENIPFKETRDYVKKVLHNTAVYQERLGRPPIVLRDLLGAPVGPRPAEAPPVREDLP